ncbi:protein kinase C-like 1 [Myzus persicae]|uniref:protein kinase C-like 1 n=1 Tax=Myzus persicae TaxID=13164 RepID=UPI000B9397F6|nr:protein kinase C-like 1 [Myzus persicae]
MVHKVKVSRPSIDYIHSELEISCVEINDGHVWKDLNIPSRILKTCAICGVKNVWSWITTIKCKECKMVCHRQCLPEFDEKICPLLVNHHDEDLSTTTNSNNKPSSVVLITGGLDGNDEVAEHDSNSSGCHAEKSASASKAPLCPLVDRPRSKSSSPSPKRESPFLFEV